MWNFVRWYLRWDERRSKDETSCICNKYYQKDGLQLPISVTRCIFSIFGLLKQGNFAKSIKYLHKVGSQFCKILSSCSRNGQKLLKCRPSGKKTDQDNPNVYFVNSWQIATVDKYIVYLYSYQDIRPIRGYRHLPQCKSGLIDKNGKLGQILTNNRWRFLHDISYKIVLMYEKTKNKAHQSRLDGPFLKKRSLLVQSNRFWFAKALLFSKFNSKNDLMRASKQCDQDGCNIFQHLAIHNIEMQPKNDTILPK